MRRWLLFTALLSAGFLLARRLRSRRRGPSGIDSAGQPESVEQEWSPAEYRPDGSVQELQAEGWAGLARSALQERFPLLTDADFEETGGNPERLAGLVAERTERPMTEVHQEILAVVSAAQPTDPSWPAR